MTVVEEQVVYPGSEGTHCLPELSIEQPAKTANNSRLYHIFTHPLSMNRPLWAG